MTTLLVIAKEPLPGRVKTRLTPPFTPEEAARLAEAALADTLRTVAAAPTKAERKAAEPVAEEEDEIEEDEEAELDMEDEADDEEE